MSEENATLGKSHSVSRFLSKDKWRTGSKKEKRSPELAQGSNADPAANNGQPFTLNEDVVDFLKPSTSRARPVSPKTPRIDIAAAQKWASAPTPDNHGLITPSSIVKKDYPRRALNLKVGFVNAGPEVIGEGGDEAESPVIEITRRLTERGGRPEFKLADAGAPQDVQYAQQDKSLVSGGPATPVQRPGSKEYAAAYQDLVDIKPSVEGDEDDISPKPLLRRTPTSFSAAGDEQELKPWEKSRPLDVSAAPSTVEPDEQSWQQPDVDSEMDDSPLDVSNRLGDIHIADRGDSENIAQEKVHTMGSEEGHIFHENAPHPVPDNGSMRLSTSTTSSFQPYSPVEYQASTFASPNSTNLSQPRPPIQNAPFSYEIPLTHGSQQPTPSPSYYPPIQSSQPSRQISMRKPVAQQPGASSQPMTLPFTSSRGSTLRPSPQPASISQDPISRDAPQNMTFKSSPQPSSVPKQTQFPRDSPQRPAFQPSPQPVNLPQQEQYLQDSPHGSTSRPSPQLSHVQQQDTSPSSARGGMDQPSRPEYVGARSADISSTASSGSPKTQYTSDPSSETSGMSRSASVAAAQAALDDFAERCSHMGGIFRLQAEFERPINEFTPMEWLRACAWWFLKGRLGIEALVRAQYGRSESRQGGELLSQPHVDLAKTWWILTVVVAEHPGICPSSITDLGQRLAEARNVGDNTTAEILEAAEILLTNLRALLSSMKRNNVMPPTHALIQGQDQTIWVKYPNLAPQLLPIFSGNMSRSLTDSGTVQRFNPLAVMAVADTRSDFSYNRTFAKVSLGTDDDSVERISLPCVVSVMRERNEWHPKVAIASQRELLTLCIQGDRKRGPSWQDVKWNEQLLSIHVQLSHGYNVHVQLPEPDFRQLYNLYNHAYQVQRSLLPHSNERVVFEVSLCDFQYADSRNPPSIPPERVKRCRVRIFEKTETRQEGYGTRKFYRGFRLLAVTSPKNRILGSASHEIGVCYPVIIEHLMDAANKGAPAMRLHVREDGRRSSLLMVFNDSAESNEMFATLNSMDVGPQETLFASQRLKGIAVEVSEQAEAYSPASRNPLGRLRWQRAVVIDKDPEDPDHSTNPTVMSESLRIIAQSEECTWTDRINLGPGELRIRLHTDGNPELVIFRPPQDDLSVTADPSRADPNLLNLIADVQRTISTLPTSRTYSFFSMKDLHTFQAAITGFSVVYDGCASAFSIGRRRPVAVLSKHKQSEATTTRVQIVTHDHPRVTQLLAFFDDFPQADALNFQLKGMDVFERHSGKSGKGKYGVKFVDAKFSLPTVEKDERFSAGKRFVSLDTLENPSEDEDLVVGFDDEQERERFLAALPAPVQSSRGLTLKRRT